MEVNATLERQKIDCNCNDCKFLIRDSEKQKCNLEFHRQLQLDAFNKKVKNLREKAESHRRNYHLEAFEDLHNEADRMKFQFDKKPLSVSYGVCSKFERSISFVPNTCQLETQSCFIHRRE